MPRAIFLLITAALCLCVAADAQNGSIAGHVTNSVTGDMVGGATITIMPVTGAGSRTPSTVTSQSDGSFHLEGLASSAYMVVCTKEGFVPAATGRGALFVNLSDGQSVTDLQVPMAPDGGVSGKVTDSEGAPLAGIRVQAFFLPGNNHRNQLQASKQSAISDKNGKFSISKLDPGSYFVLASPNSGQTKPRQDGATPVDTFYPQALSIADAATVSIAAGQDVVADIRVTWALTHSVQGKIAEMPAGSDLKSLRLQMAPSGAMNLQSLSRSIKLNPDLSFSVAGVVPGQYELLLTSGGGSRSSARHLAARESVEVGATDLTGIVMRPTSPVTLTGSISIQNAGSGQVAAISVRAVPLENTSDRRFAFAQVGGDRTFTLSNLEPAPYLIAVTLGQSGLYVASLTLDQQDILDRAVDLSDLSGGQIAVVVRSGTGKISGTVSENPSIVVLAPRRLAPDASNVRIAYTQDSSGAFAIPNVPPGDYLLYAADRTNPSVWVTPVFLEAIQNLGQAVHLEEGGSATVELAKTPDALLRDQAARLGVNFP